MGGNALAIRVGNDSDHEALVTSAISMIKEADGRELERDGVSSGVTKILSNSERGFYVVAEMDGEVVGSMLVTRTWIDLADGCWWWIHCLHVRHTARKQGVFRKMYEFITERAKLDPDVVGLRLLVHETNADARQAYDQLGMELIPLVPYQKKWR